MIESSEGGAEFVEMQITFKGNNHDTRNLNCPLNVALRQIIEVEYLEEDLSRERGFSARLREGIGAVLDFLDRHLPEQFRPLVEKARELLPVPEVQQPEREQERGHTWGGMEL